MSTRSIVLAVEGISQYGGVAAYLQNLARGLEPRGWKVHLLVTNYRGEGHDQFCPTLERHDLSEMPLSSKKVFTAARWVNSIKPDVLLINHCSLMNYALPLLDSAIKPVAVLHSDAEAFYHSAARFADYIFRWIAPTPGVASNFVGRLPAPLRSRVQLIAHGIDTGVFRRRDRELETAAEEIAFVGFIAENKGADLLPVIMTAVMRKRPGAHLTIAGYGPLREALQDAFAKLTIGDRVTFAGKLEPCGVADLLQRSDVFLLPTQVEGFGLAIAEAMLCGAVPIVSRLPGVTDWIIEQRRTGILCEPRDADAFANAAVELFEDQSQLADISLDAIAAASSRFSIDAMLDAYETLFSKHDDRLKRGPHGPLMWSALTTNEVVRKNISGHLRKLRSPRKQAFMAVT